jgi:hypothetical protein
MLSHLHRLICRKSTVQNAHLPRPCRRLYLGPQRGVKRLDLRHLQPNSPEVPLGISCAHFRRQYRAAKRGLNGPPGSLAPACGRWKKRGPKLVNRTVSFPKGKPLTTEYVADLGDFKLVFRFFGERGNEPFHLTKEEVAQFTAQMKSLVRED